MSNHVERALSESLIGKSTVMHRVRALISKLAPSAVPVLIQGPTGSGKELVAQALHKLSRRAGSFVAFNVCAVADGMFEDALFGHVRGAFTGAVSDTPGYLLEAHRGTLFLDEISSLPAAAQAKLLRALDTKRFRALGTRADRYSEFRVVSATNEDLSELAASGRFRNDLFFRLRGSVITLPALGDRLEDVPLLAQHFAGAVSSSTGTSITISPPALEMLTGHRWPGNVRELKGVVECAIALSDGGVVALGAMARALAVSRPAQRRLSAHRQEFVARRLLEVLEHTHWNIEGAATILGVHPATVYRRLARIGRESLSSNTDGAHASPERGSPSPEQRAD